MATTDSYRERRQRPSRRGNLAPPAVDPEQAFWREVRRAVLTLAAAIEARYDLGGNAGAERTRSPPRLC